jgi:hypothetical protein
MKKSISITIIFLIILSSILIEFTNSKMKLEKPDEDWAWKNTTELHINEKTLVEESSKNKLELIFFTSNNFFHLNYFIIKFYNKLLEYIDSIFYIKQFGYENIFLKKEFKSKLDSKEYSNAYIDGNFKFAKNKYIFKEKESNFFYHYNYIYFNNIILFLIAIYFIYNINYNYLYPTLIYFLSPQINSFILFINSDFFVILLTPILYILFKEKKFLYIFVIIFLLQLFNRSNILFILLFLHYIYFNNNYFKIKIQYRIIFYIFIFFIIIFTTYYYLDYLNNFNLFINSGLFYIFENNLYLFFYNFFKSLGIFIISHLYLNGQNSFILSYYDYFIFSIYIIFYLTYSILYFKNKLIYNALLVFFSILFFMNGFDQFRHHPFIYTILIFSFFNYDHNKVNLLKYINISYVFFLIYMNIKSSYLESFIF